MHSKWEECFISFGSNLGNRKNNIHQAINHLRKNKRIKIEKISSIIETKPVGIRNQPKFLNGVLKIETNLPPRSLLKVLSRIEENLGRIRTHRFAARTIDLDILLYGNRKIDNKNLKIPHPRMWQREFVLRPLYEIAPGLKH